MRVATEGDDLQSVLTSSIDVLILTSGTPSGSGDTWALGPKTTPVLTADTLPERIDAKVVIVDVPDGAEIEAAVRSRLPKGAITLRSAHAAARKEFAEDSFELLGEFVTAAYDKYKPDVEDLARVWVEVEDAAVKASGGALTRRREPLRFVRTLVG